MSRLSLPTATAAVVIFKIAGTKGSSSLGKKREIEAQKSKGSSRAKLQMVFLGIYHFENNSSRLSLSNSLYRTSCCPFASWLNSSFSLTKQASVYTSNYFKIWNFIRAKYCLYAAKSLGQYWTQIFYFIVVRRKFKGSTNDPGQA